MGVVANYAASEGRVEPYVSLDEVKFSPTAAAIDFSNLIENASQNVQDRALYELIVRASNKADIYTMGQFGTLNATKNTEGGRYRPNRQAQLIIHPYFTPILELTDLKVRWGPGQGLSDIPISDNNVSIERQQFIITPQGPLGLQFGGLGIAGGEWSYMSQMFVQYSYINGWPNTFTSAQASAGSTTLNVNDTTGMYEGQNLTIWDGMDDEYVQIDSVVSATQITLTTGTKYRHGTGVNISALPAVVKQAVIHFVVALIKQRGQGGLVLSEIGEPVAVSSRSETSMTDEAQGYDLLDEFKSVWGRA